MSDKSSEIRKVYLAVSRQYLRHSRKSENFGKPKREKPKETSPWSPRSCGRNSIGEIHKTGRCWGGKKPRKSKIDGSETVCRKSAEKKGSMKCAKPWKAYIGDDLRRERRAGSAEWIKRDKAEEGSTLNKLLNKRGPPADAIVEQTGRRGRAAPRYLSASGCSRAHPRVCTNQRTYVRTYVRESRRSRIPRRNLLESSRRRRSVV